jgi:hypothetical protein
MILVSFLNDYNHAGKMQKDEMKAGPVFRKRTGG